MGTFPRGQARGRRKARPPHVTADPGNERLPPALEVSFAGGIESYPTAERVFKGKTQPRGPRLSRDGIRVGPDCCAEMLGQRCIMAWILSCLKLTFFRGAPGRPGRVR